MTNAFKLSVLMLPLSAGLLGSGGCTSPGQASRAPVALRERLEAIPHIKEYIPSIDSAVSRHSGDRLVAIRPDPGGRAPGSSCDRLKAMA